MSKVVGVSLIFLLMSFMASALEVFSPPVEQEFTYIQHYKYQQQKYKDVVINQFDESERDVNEGPDRQLVQFFSALMKDDYQWWLNSWNQATQKDFSDKAVLKKGRRSYNYWRATANKKSIIRLKDFVVTGQIALIGVLINNEYHLFPFELENGRWRLNQAFMGERMYQKLKEKLESEL